MTKANKARNSHGTFVTAEQAQAAFNMSRNGINQLAKECNAIIHFGRRCRYDIQKMEIYLRSEYTG